MENENREVINEQEEQANEIEVHRTQEEKPEAKEAKKYSDADVDAIIDKKFAKWQKEQEAKIDEAKKLERMDAQQKAEYERDQLQARLAELERENNTSRMQKVARGMLKDSGVQVADELLNVLIASDAETTQVNIQAFADMYKTDVEKAVNERLKGKTPSRMGGGKITKNEILNIADTEERRKAIADNLELFN